MLKASLLLYITYVTLFARFHNCNRSSITVPRTLYSMSESRELHGARAVADHIHQYVEKTSDEANRALRINNVAAYTAFIKSFQVIVQQIETASQTHAGKFNALPKDIKQIVMAKFNQYPTQSVNTLEVLHHHQDRSPFTYPPTVTQESLPHPAHPPYPAHPQTTMVPEHGRPAVNQNASRAQRGSRPCPPINQAHARLDNLLPTYHHHGLPDPPPPQIAHNQHPASKDNNKIADNLLQQASYSTPQKQPNTYNSGSCSQFILTSGCKVSSGPASNKP